MEKDKFTSFPDRCRKCNQPLFKSKAEEISRFCLEGYAPDVNICTGCNATNSVIKKMSLKQEITIEDLKTLPNVLIFDPKKDNPDEMAYGMEFNRQVEELTKKEKLKAAQA